MKGLWRARSWGPSPSQQQIIEITAQKFPRYAQTRSLEPGDLSNVFDVARELRVLDPTLSVGAEIDWVHLAVLRRLATLRKLPPTTLLSPKE